MKGPALIGILIVAPPAAWVRWLPILVALCLMAGIVRGHEAEYPLQPPDRGSPRASLATFLAAGDALAAYLADEYLASPTREAFQHLSKLGAAGLLVLGADWLDIPVYGIIAGLGVGGLAFALAAKPSLENLIGGLNLFADKPMKVGDLGKYGAEIGWIEAIGIRSTRIRGRDRTLTSIPNGMLATMPVVNMTQRDRMLIQSLVTVRYETSPEQLRYLLAKIREMLVGHPRIDPESARARFIDFGASSLDIEVYAYVQIPDWAEFLAIREDLLLRIMDIVAHSGTSFAFPSQTLYFARDGGLDAQGALLAEAEVRQWREESSLPFPNFPPERLEQMRGQVAYPPPGSPGRQPRLDPH